MLRSTLFTLLLSSLATSSNLPAPQTIFSNDAALPNHLIPSIHDSAIQARRILRLESIGTLSTIFPLTHARTLENRPSEVAGSPIGLMDYFGDCEPSSGNPTLLAMHIATSFKNVKAGSNITLSLRYHPPPNYRRSPASLPRFSLVGTVEELSDKEIRDSGVARCFARYHPEAKWWLPGNVIHDSYWVRLVVRDIYWVGGFGDRAYIGWIPLEEWQSVTEEEIEKCRLPGEATKAWNSWFDYFWSVGL